MTRHGRLVYSTDDPGAGKKRRPPRRAAPPASSAPPPGLKPGVVYVERSRKGRGGKTVTLVLNLPGSEADKGQLLKELKTTCGAGGTLKDGVLEIQGDHRDKVMDHLRARGHQVKPRGG
jgi:translation initiation factor 1